VAVAVTIVVAGGGVLWTLRSDGGSGRPQRTAAETVSGFLQAQRDGDCERLVDLVTERSWSDGGRLGRGEFLERCADALDHYDLGMEQTDIDLELLDDLGEPTDDPDRAVAASVVAPALPDDLGLAGPGEDGRLVRQAGEWRVETGDGILRIGRSVDQTVQGYVEAYNEGDCERVADHLSEAAWTWDGELDRRESMATCTEAAAARRERRWQVPAQVQGMVGVVLEDDGRATAEVAMVQPTGMAPLDPDEVVLVREGLEWKLHGSRRDGSDEVDVRWPLPAIGLVELQALLLGELSVPEGTCFSFQDGLGRSDPSLGGSNGDTDTGTVTISRRFSGRRACDSPVFVSLRRLPGDPEDATGSTGRGRAFPGFPDSSGFHTSCEDTCRAVAVRHGIEAEVSLYVGDDIDDLERVVAILGTQLERL
jgi:hypothetical protein